MKALVTGASGFVGHAVCAELRERDHEVAALVRRPGSEPPGSSAVQGDLVDAERARPGRRGRPPRLRDPPRRGDRLAARRVQDRGGERRGHPPAARGLRRRRTTALRLRLDGGHRRRGRRPAREGSPLTVETAYGRSKQEGERLVRELGARQRDHPPEPCLRAGRLVRAGVRQAAQQPGRFAVIGSGRELVGRRARRGRRHGLRRCGGARAVRSSVPRRRRRADSLLRLRRAHRRGARLGRPRRIPAWLARAVAGADPVRAVVRSARSSNALIKRELSWQPRFRSAREGVPDAVAQLSP